MLLLVSMPPSLLTPILMGCGAVERHIEMAQPKKPPILCNLIPSSSISKEPMLHCEPYIPDLHRNNLPHAYVPLFLCLRCIQSPILRYPTLEHHSCFCNVGR